MQMENQVSDVVQDGGGGLPGGDDVRAIGEIIRDTRNLTAEQVANILQYQKEHGVRFGEAAIALGFATSEDVLRALAQQFKYAFGNAEREKKSPELVVLNQPFGHQAEAFRAIRAQIIERGRYREDDGGGLKIKRALAVVSPSTGEGKTFFCANLAIALSQLGSRTLVIDADFRGPRLHQVFGVESNFGLAGLLSGRRGENVIKAVRGVPNLFVLPVGISPPNPTELLEGPAFGLLLQEVLTKFEHVIVDTPAGIYGVDGFVAAARCGSALVVARKDEAKLAALQETVGALNATSTRILGVVMNEF